jgi:hypothetical protein
MKKGLIILVLLIPCLMMAQMSIGVRAGMAKFNTAPDMFLTFGGMVGYNVMPKLLAGAEVDYSSKSGASDIAIAAVGKYALIEAPVKVSLGAGIGMHMFNGGGGNEFAAHGILEAGYPINPNLSVIAQFKYAYIFETGAPYVIYGTAGVVYSLAK